MTASTLTEFSRNKKEYPFPSREKSARVNLSHSREWAREYFMAARGLV